MTESMVTRVAKAIDGIQLWARFNDFTSDRAPGLPLEVCRYGRDGEDEIVVLARFPGGVNPSEALGSMVSGLRARAAIEAMREPTERMLRAADSWTDLVGAYPEANTPEERRFEFKCAWQAMIDAALEEGKQ